MNKTLKITLWVLGIIFILLAFFIVSDYIKVQKVKSMAVYIKSYYDTNGTFPTQAEVETKYPSFGKNYQIADSQSIFFIYSLFLNEPFAFGGQYRDIMFGVSYGQFSFNGLDLVHRKCISTKSQYSEYVCFPYKAEFPKYLLIQEHTISDDNGKLLLP